MNKLFTKIAALVLGMTMAVGVGVAVGSGVKASEVNAAAGDTATYEFHFATGSGNTWGTSSSSDSGTKFKNVTWVTTLSNAGSYNNGYAGQQFGTSSKSGSVIAETKSNWGEESSATSFYGKTEITSIDLWLNNGSGTINTYDVKVGGVSCSKTGTISKNTSASGNYKNTSKVSFTPASGHTSGKVRIEVGTSQKAFYFAGVDIYCQEPGGETKELTGLRIASGEDVVKKEYDVGDSFDPTGLVIQAQWDDTWDTENNIVNNVIWTPESLATSTTSVTGTFTSGVVSKTVTIDGLTVVSPDVVLNTTNKPYTSTSGSNTDEENVTLDGIEYHSYAAYIYNSYLSFNRSQSGAYLGNNTAFAKNIKKIVVDYNSGGSSKFTMYEGAAALTETATISPSATGTGKITYSFSDTVQFFKFKLTTTGTYCNINSISIYLGSAPVAKVVDSVSIATPGSVYVGKTLQLSATVTYLGGVASDHNVTWRISEGSGATVSDSGLVTAIATTATTIEAKSVEKDSGGNQVTATVTITPLANPIVSVVWDTSAAKKSYNIGDPLDITGVTATGTNAAGDDDIEIELTAENFSGFDSSEAVESQTITVTYLSFSTTYTISIVAAPDIELLGQTLRNSSSYGDGSATVGGIGFTYAQLIGNANYMQLKKDGAGYFYNTDPLGQYISKVEIKVRTNGITLYVGTDVLDTSESAAQSINVTAGDSVTFTPTNQNNQYLLIIAEGAYAQVDYVNIWYAPFLPTVTLDKTSFEFDEGSTGEIEVNATASHFTDDSGVVFTAHSSDQSVLDDENIAIDGGYILIYENNVNPGTTTVTVTGTYNVAEEVATASFTITCDAASRNLLSISITEDSEDTTFTEGDTFTITGLVITGTFDAAPLTADVTSECTFKLWDGSSESALTPGTTTLNIAGDFTVRISDVNSAAAETLTYSIHVNEIPKFSIANFEDLYEGAQALIVSTQDSQAVGAYGSSIYGSESVTIDGEGKITEWGNALVFTVRMYGDRVAFEYGNGKYIGYNGSGNSANQQSELIGNDKASWTFDDNHGLLSSTDGRYLQYNSTSPRFACYTGGQHDVSIYISSNSSKTAVLGAETFVNKYLHMRDYDPQLHVGEEGSNYCSDSEHNYYLLAKAAYNDLSAEEKTEFASLADAKARYEAWALANRDGAPYDGNDDIQTPLSGRIVFFGNNENSNAIAIVVIVSVVSLTAIGGYFFLRKKREQN